MKAVYIANNPGSRCSRMVRGLVGQVDFHLVARAPIRTDTPFVGEHYWRTVEELKQLLEQPWAQEADLWVVAQQLDAEWVPPFVSLCRGNKKIRIVVDVRDMTTLIPKPSRDSFMRESRLEAVSLDEMSAFRIADGIIHVSAEIAGACEMIHRNVKQTPTYVLPCLVNEHELIRDWPAERAGVVYAGGLGPKGPTFRAYHDVFEGFAHLGIPLDVYASPTGRNLQEIMDEYTLRGCRVHARVADPLLIPSLSRFKWGVVGFPHRFPLGDGALPNKLFEYFAAGLPVIVINADAAGQLVTENGLGIWVTNAKQFEMLPELLAKPELWEAMSARVLELRDKMTMESRADELVAFFKRVLKKAQTKPGGERLALQSVTLEDQYGEATNLEELFGRPA